jgi:hypothetical protein
MKLISRLATITSFSKIRRGRVSRRVESIGERTVPAHSQQNLRSPETFGRCGIEKHLAQIGRMSHYMRSLLILIFSAVVTYGIPTHAQERIDANLPPLPLTHTRTLFIFPVLDQSNPLEDAEQNPHRQVIRLPRRHREAVRLRYRTRRRLRRISKTIPKGSRPSVCCGSFPILRRWTPISSFRRYPLARNSYSPRAIVLWTIPHTPGPESWLVKPCS